MELFATGQVDGGLESPLSTADRLAQLRGNRPRLAHARFDIDDVHHFTAAIDVIVFPSRDGTQSVPEWSHERVGILVHDFTIAPEEDLVVLVGHRHEGAIDEPIPIHLRTLSSNKPHPMATLPVLFAHPQPPDVFISDFTIQIYNSFLGILFWGSHAFHLLIWDWCTGDIIVDYPAPAGIHFDDFSFLSDSSFLIPSSSAAGAALRVYSFAHLLPPSTPLTTHSTKTPYLPVHLPTFQSAEHHTISSLIIRDDGLLQHVGHLNGPAHLGEHHRSSDVAPAGLSGLTRRPLLSSLLRFPKPKKEWNVGIMTCRVDPLPRYDLRRYTASEGLKKDEKRKGKEKAVEGEEALEGQEEEEEEEIEQGEETRFAPRRAFHADPDRAIIALSSGLVPVRSGVFAGGVYLDEGSLAWEEGERSEETSSMIDEFPGCASTSSMDHQFSSTYESISDDGASTSAHTNPPPAGTLVPWIDLHMPPSSIPIPTEPPLMSVFDHSSESSGHEPIQIQIHDATIGEEGGGLAGAAAAYSHGPPIHTHTQTQAPPQAPPQAQPQPQTHSHPQNGPEPLVMPQQPPQQQEEEPPIDDLDRLYFNLFVHCRALRKFADPDAQGPTRQTHRPRVFEWNDWAPPITRLLTRMPMPAWACISHGQRFATLGVVGEGVWEAEGSGSGILTSSGQEQSTTPMTQPDIEPTPVPIGNIDPWIPDGGPGGANFERPFEYWTLTPMASDEAIRTT
ncbi:A Receptor for Ubiquitination Targets [Rhizoctonia solani]|uniref:A Receptor for Ubiquitination Targets n=1 Tax=Rhizoctonia solani TaxID=456999 RepID=A0A8H7M501_9AGAM|nr:A Receptor for Ubiquitination Targets [Rhizoctonia solani]